MTDNDEMEELEEILAAYVIDALDQIERDEVDIYLDANPAGRDEVARLTRAFDELVVARVAEATPPADLWDRISIRLADEGKARRDGTPTIVTERRDSGSSGSAGEDRSRGDAARGEDPIDLASRRSRSRSRSSRATVTAVVLAAAAVILVALGLSLRPQGADTRVQQEAALAASQPGATSGSLTSAEGNLDMKVVLDANGRMYVVPQRMPALDDDHAYQLWALDSGTPVSLGVLRGPATMEVPAGQHPSKIAISKEPARGSAQPTTTPLAAGQLA